MTGPTRRVVMRRDQLEARRERRRAVEITYLVPDMDRVMVHASRGRGVVLGAVLAVLLWAVPWCQAHVWPWLQQAVGK